MQLLGEFGIASDNVDVALPWLEQALALARRENYKAPEAIGVHSLGVARWILGDLHGADSLLAESIERFRALRGYRGHDSVPAQHRGGTDRAARRSGRREAIFEDTLQPWSRSLRRCSRLRDREPGGIARVLGDLDRAGTLLNESGHDSRQLKTSRVSRQLCPASVSGARGR